MAAGALLRAFNHHLGVTTIPLIDDFVKDLELTDWNYEFADDNGVYMRGREKQKAIEYVRNTNQDLNKIAAAYGMFRNGNMTLTEFHNEVALLKAEALIAA